MSTQGKLSRVSLIVITYNEETNIGRCIESVAGVGEVIVVDSFSTDGTVEAARGLGAQVFQRRYLSAAEQKNWALGKAQGEWVLVLDADEALSPDLRGEIENVLAEPACDGFWLRRRSTFLGRRIRFCGWQRDRVLRLFRRGMGHYPAKEVHERLELSGRTRQLKGFIEHVPYRDIGDYIDRMKSYSGRGAIDLHVRGNRITSRGLDPNLRGDAIRLWYSHENLIEANQVHDSRNLIFANSNDNRIVGNDVRGSRVGMQFVFAHDNLVQGNTLTGNATGIMALYSNDLTIRANRLWNARHFSGSGISE